MSGAQAQRRAAGLLHKGVGLLPVAVVAIAVAIGVVILASQGLTSQPADPGVSDPGPFTRWGLPVSRTLRNLGAAVAIGGLAVVAFCLPANAGPRSRPWQSPEVSSTQAIALSWAAAGAAVWAVAGFVTFALSYSELAGLPLSVIGQPRELWSFARDFEYGRALLASSMVGLAVAVAAVTIRRLAPCGLVLVVAVIGLWPIALTGHAAGARNHDTAVNMQMAHLLGLSIWLGGLFILTVLVLRGHLQHLREATSRFSRMALFAFLLLGFSGIVAALLRLEGLGQLDRLGTSYGAVLVVKVAALAALGVLGWRQRRMVQGRMSEEDPLMARRLFLLLAALELGILAAATGLGIALSRMPPPVGPEQPLTTAEAFLGYPLPGPLDAQAWFAAWRFDTLWSTLALVAAGWYLVSVRRLRRRGDNWPLGRTLLWLLGCSLLLWATSGAPGVYGDVLFSMHMVQHMTVATAVPLFLVLGSPVTLALRAMVARSDGSRGAREWLLSVVHAPLVAIVGHPLVAPVIFIVGLPVFYYSGIFEASLRSHTVHQLMVAHFLIAGYLFANVVCGSDPGQVRPAYPMRVLLVLVTFGFHAFFSISLMSSTSVLAEEWFAALGRDWGPSLERDQYVGASLGWALGDYPLALIAGAIIVGWVHDDKRERLRFDRNEDRSGDKRLNAYNEFLQSRAEAAARSADHQP